MANTKVTARKSKEICPVCFHEVDGKEIWIEHVMKCTRNLLVCEKCHVSFKKKEYFLKHMKMKHPDVGPSEETDKDAPSISTMRKDSTDYDSEWDEDPEIQLGDDPAERSIESLPSTSDLVVGRMVRKRTAPSPVHTSRKVMNRTEVRSVSTGVSIGTQTEGRMMIHQYTQTEGTKKRMKEVTITKYLENGRSVKKITESEVCFDI
ncbi:uncharacterized protein LOC125683886 [Ostrea edulis]|uniref:uncharacterized protein LOC125683886 n=1 Tax=Ostrea edulis TaxID=37623 RepID=UPI0024AFECEC|nr:uncharacterized protein LOC125683886 [Ostrea edulis]